MSDLCLDLFVAGGQAQLFGKAQHNRFLFNLIRHDLHCDRRVLGELTLGAPDLLDVLAQALAVVPHTVFCVAHLNCG